MKVQPINPPEPSATLPEQVWPTLTPLQQKTVLQTLVQVCVQLIRQASQVSQEQPDEPVAK